MKEATASSIRTIGLFGNPEKSQIDAAIATVRSLAEAAGVDVIVTKALLPHAMEPVTGVDHEELAVRSDVIVAFGGDGTMLRAARTIGDHGTPLLGINLGSLGYLTDIPLNELSDAIGALLRGEFHVVERKRIAGAIRHKGGEVCNFRALNDIVVNMGPLPRALDMEIRLDRSTMGRFLGDGLIVSTTTGSTAYNLSAGGPIVHPSVGGYLITPICPHSLAVRPILVPESMKVELKLHDVGQGATLTADGQAAVPLGKGDRVTYAIDSSTVRLIKFANSDFFRAMRRKLKWGAIKRRPSRG